MDQQQIIQIQMMEQEINQLNEQLGLIDQNITELQGLVESLDEIHKSKENEIMANLGKRIYIPVEIKDKKLLIDVGKNNFVKKSIPDAKKIVDEQIGRLTEAKGQIMERLTLLQGEMNKIMFRLQEEQSKKNDDS